MRKSLLELQYLQEQKLNEEIKKIDNAEQNFKMLGMFKSLAIIFFTMNLFVIIMASLAEFIMIQTNFKLISFIIILFAFLSLVSLFASIFYRNKTMNILKQHYEAN